MNSRAGASRIKSAAYLSQGRVVRVPRHDKASVRGMRNREAILYVIAILAAVIGLVLLVLMLRERPVITTVIGPAEVAQADGLSLRVNSTEWIGHGHEDQGQGFPMPASMMPDMPVDGQQRFKVELSLQNTNGSPRRYSAEEFRLQADNGDTWQPISRSFSNGVLGLGQTMNSALFFDVPEIARGLFLVWNRDGTEFFMPLHNSEAAPDHAH